MSRHGSPVTVASAVIGNGRITRRGTDAAIHFPDHLRIVEIFIGRVSPGPRADVAVQVFGKGLGEAVGERLRQHRTVNILLLLVNLDQLIEAVTGGYRKCAQGIDSARIARRDEIGQREIGFVPRVQALLAQADHAS